MKFKLFVSVLVFLTANVAAADLVVSGARIKAPVPGQTLSAGYFDLANKGSESISIVGVSSGSAPRVEMHTHVMKDGMMGMVQMDSVEVGPGESLNFVAGGHHLMIFDPDSRTLASGEFDFIFALNDGSHVEVTASVEQFVE